MGSLARDFAAPVPIAESRRAKPRANYGALQPSLRALLRFVNPSWIRHVSGGLGRGCHSSAARSSDSDSNESKAGNDPRRRVEDHCQRPVGDLAYSESRVRAGAGSTSPRPPLRRATCQQRSRARSRPQRRRARRRRWTAISRPARVSSAKRRATQLRHDRCARSGG